MCLCILRSKSVLIMFILQRRGIALKSHIFSLYACMQYCKHSIVHTSRFMLHPREWRYLTMFGLVAQLRKNTVLLEDTPILSNISLMASMFPDAMILSLLDWILLTKDGAQNFISFSQHAILECLTHSPPLIYHARYFCTLHERLLFKSALPINRSFDSCSIEAIT